MNPNTLDQEALFRFQIIAPLFNQPLKHGAIKQQFKKIAEQYYEHPRKKWVKYSHRTIEEWYYNYRLKGFSGLVGKKRSDRGSSRTITKEVAEQIEQLKQEKPSISIPQILKRLQEKGFIEKGELSQSSVYRYVNQLPVEFNLKTAKSDPIRKFTFAHSNECWQSDVHYGPYLWIEGFKKKKRIYVYALLDDATRVIPATHIALFENTEHFLHCLKQGLLKKGIPFKIYLDNGSYFRTPIVQKIGDRIGMRVVYGSPAAPYKRGKIERLWRRMDAECLDDLDRKKIWTLEQLNQVLQTWVEKEYHHTVHHTLKTTPLLAWQNKTTKIRYPDPEKFQVDFLAENTRKIKNDGTFSLNGKLYDFDSHYAGMRLVIRYDAFAQEQAYVYHNNTKIGAVKPVNEIENAHSPRVPNVLFNKQTIQEDDSNV